MSPPTPAKTPLERSTLRGTGPEAEASPSANHVPVAPAGATPSNELAAIEARAEPNEEVRAALAELKADLPPDATGPFLRRVGHLRSLREPEASERKEHLDRAGVHTHPVGVVAAPRVIVSPRPLRGEHVTSPSLRKQQELGLDTPLVGTGKTPGGQTLRLATPDLAEGLATADGTVGRGASDLGAPSPSARSPLARWAVVVVVLLGLVGGLVIWLVREVRNDERQRLDAATSAVVSAPLALETSRAAPSTPNMVEAASASVPVPTPVSATASRTESPSANRPAQQGSATPSAARSAVPNTTSSAHAPLPPLPNTTAPTATSGLPND